MERNVPKNKNSSVQTRTESAEKKPTSAPKRRRTSPAEPGIEASLQGAAGRSLEVLRLIARSGGSVGLADMSQTIGLPKSTLHRICGQLSALGFLVQEDSEKTFAVGPALRELAFDALNNGVVRGLRHHVLSELVATVGETCNLTTLDGAEVIYLDRVEARWPLRLNLEVGSRVPVHCTASGKLFMALLPEALGTKVVENLTLEKLTEKTISSKGALRVELATIRKQGYSIDSEEFIQGLVALAVPVKDAKGVTRAALAVHAPTARMPVKRILEWLKPLQLAAGKMQNLI
jgi:IclR family transcriptional regulator, acetate operon repressor